MYGLLRQGFRSTNSSQTQRALKGINYHLSDSQFSTKAGNLQQNSTSGIVLTDKCAEVSF
jgi:hypothetical protein